MFEPNPGDIASLRFEFDDTAEAVLYVTSTSSDRTASWLVGLDGVYRMSAGDYDLPQGMRGAWADALTFVLEHDQIGNNEHAMYRLHFEADRVVIEGQETAHELGVRIEGRRHGL